MTLSIRAFSFWITVVVGLAAAVACHDATPAPQTSCCTLPVVVIQVIQGDHQTGRPCEALADSIVVRAVSATTGQPDGGATIYWSTTATGSKMAPAISTTNALGYTSTRWTLGCGPGLQTGAATTSAATDPSFFTATAVPDSASRSRTR